MSKQIGIVCLQCFSGRRPCETEVEEEKKQFAEESERMLITKCSHIRKEQSTIFGR